MSVWTKRIEEVLPEYAVNGDGPFAFRSACTKTVYLFWSAQGRDEFRCPAGIICSPQGHKTYKLKPPFHMKGIY
jgi:hypothetical protein